MSFKLVGGEKLRLVEVAKASGTVISAGDFAGMTSGLAVDAAAATAAIAWCPKGAADGKTTCEVTVGNDFVLEGTSDANFAVTDKGLEVDLTAAQLIDIGESTTDVLKVDISTVAGTVGATTGVKVRINKPLF